MDVSGLWEETKRVTKESSRSKDGPIRHVELSSGKIQSEFLHKPLSFPSSMCHFKSILKRRIDLY